MPFEYSTIRTDCRKKVTKTQMVVECNLTKPEGKVNKLLLKKGVAKILSYETLSGEVRYTMNVDFCAVFLDENDSIDSMNYVEVVNDNIKDEKINSFSKLIFDLQMIDIQVVSVSGNRIILQSVIEITLYDLASCEKKCITNLDNVLSKNEEIENFVLTSFSTGKTNISKEIDIKDNIDKVLVAEGKGIVTKVSAGLDCIIVEGKCLIEVTFCSYGDMTDVFSKNYEVEFNYEMESAGAMVSNFADANCYLDNLSTVVTIDEDNSNIIKIDADVVINGYTFDKENISLPVDAFSVENNVRLSKNQIDTIFLVDSFVVNEKFDSTSYITENMPKVDKILSSFCTNLNITNVKNMDQGVEIEGIASVGVLYYSEDRICSVETETPFSCMFKNNNINKESILNVIGCITDTNARHKKLDSIDVYIEVVFKIDVFKCEKIEYIEDIEILDEKKDPQSHISLYIARENESLWDICKILNADSDSILEQNKELTFPLSNGDRVLLYRNANIN